LLRVGLAQGAALEVLLHQLLVAAGDFHEQGGAGLNGFFFEVGRDLLNRGRRLLAGLEIQSVYCRFRHDRGAAVVWLVDILDD
jgi:hypothetical protein